MQLTANVNAQGLGNLFINEEIGNTFCADNFFEAWGPNFSLIQSRGGLSAEECREVVRKLRSLLL